MKYLSDENKIKQTEMGFFLLCLTARRHLGIPTAAPNPFPRGGCFSAAERGPGNPPRGPQAQATEVSDLTEQTKLSAVFARENNDFFFSPCFQQE